MYCWEAANSLAICSLRRSAKRVAAITAPYRSVAVGPMMTYVRTSGGAGAGGWHSGGEDQRRAGSDHDGVLDVGRRGAGGGQDRPAVAGKLDLATAGGDDRLDRQHEALGEQLGVGRV